MGFASAGVRPPGWHHGSCQFPSDILATIFELGVWGLRFGVRGYRFEVGFWCLEFTGRQHYGVSQT